MSPTNPNTAEINDLAAVQNSIVSVQLNVNRENLNLIDDYRTKHDNWRQNEANHPGMQPEPQPPLAYVISWVADPTTGPGSIGPYGDTPIYYPAPVQGSQPVCPPLPTGLPTISPSLSTAKGGLMGAMVAEGGVPPAEAKFSKSVALYTQQVTAADGSVFVRVQ